MKQMTVDQFKTWFDGLTAGLVENASLGAPQLKALRQAVENLVDSSEIPSKPENIDGGQNGPAPAPVPKTPEPVVGGKTIEEIFRDMQKQKSEEKSPTFDPIRGWPTYRDPFDPFSDEWTRRYGLGPQIFCQSAVAGNAFDQELQDLSEALTKGLRH